MMTKPPMLKLLFAAALTALCFLAQPAWSITITQDDIPNGESFVEVNDAEGHFIVETSQGRVFRNTSFNNYDGFFGAARGFVRAEIDISEADGVAECILISFPDESQEIEEITIGRLFAAGYWDDDVNEVARIVATGGDTEQVGYLTVTGPNTGTWQVGAGPVIDLVPISAGDDTGAGVWTILDPFIDFEVDSLAFYAEQLSGVDPEDRGENSDYALHTIVTSVPEPLTASLLGLGLVGLGILGRRQRA